MSSTTSFTSTLDSTLFHKEQVETSIKIVQSFETKRFGLMMAQMQSGKTSTFLCTACLMLATHKVEHVYILCGSNENELHTQLRKDIHTAIESFVSTNEEKMDTVTKRRIQFGISAYKSSHMDVLDIPEHTLIIWDESHYAQSKKNKPAFMLERNGICLDGSVETKLSCMKKNCYVLSISATPFSELIHLVHSTCKFFVQMNPGIGYKGVKQYYEDGCILESYPIKTNPYYFQRVLEENSNHKNFGYGIVRATSDNYITIKNIASKCGWDIVIYNSSTKKVFENGLNDLQKEPKANTLVVLDGMCRMGKVVPKQYISFVYESNNTKHMDTILQSLLGRMCGYGPFNPNGTMIYIPSYFLQCPDEEKILKAKHTVMNIAKMYSTSNISNEDRKKIYETFTKSFQLYTMCPLQFWIETNMGNGTNIKKKRNKDSILSNSFENFVPEIITDRSLVDMVCYTSNRKTKKTLRKTGNIGEMDKITIVSEIASILQKNKDTHLFQNKTHFEEILYILNHHNDCVVFKNINPTKKSSTLDTRNFHSYVEYKKPFPILSNESKYIQSNKRVCIVFDDSNPTYIGICGYSLFQQKNSETVETKDTSKQCVHSMFTTTGNEVYCSYKKTE